MRKILIIVSIVIVMIISYYLVSAFVLQQQKINKQSFYVHLQPEWNSYPQNLVYEVTNVWNQKDTTPLSSQERIKIAREANVEEVQYQHQKPYIVVRNSNTNCHDSWEPHYARFGADTLRHYIEFASGLQKHPDPNITIYTTQPSNQDRIEHESQIKSGYSQFIPICASKDGSTFDYSVRINDERLGFDVYFVPSIQMQEFYENGDSRFSPYVDGSCSGQNYVRFSGTCNNVSRDSGLLIVIPDTLNLPLTKIEVWLYEK